MQSLMMQIFDIMSKSFIIFFDTLRKTILSLVPSKARTGATEVFLLGHSISGFGLRPDLGKKSALSEMSMPKDNGQVHSLPGGLSHYRRFWPNLGRDLQPLTAPLKKGISFDSTPAMWSVVREGLQNLLNRPPWRSLTGMPYKINAALFSCALTPVRMNLVLSLISTNLMIPFDQSRSLVAPQRLMNETSQSWTLRLMPLSGPSSIFANACS